MPQKILACVEYDINTATCTTQAWIDQPALLPALTTDGALELGAAIAYLWAAAWVVKMLKKVVNESS